MSGEGHDSPMDDESVNETSIAGGDSADHGSKPDANQQSPKKKDPPPVRPRPQTSRGPRKPISSYQEVHVNESKGSDINAGSVLSKQSSSTAGSNGLSSSSSGIEQVDAPIPSGSVAYGSLNPSDIPSTSKGTGNYYSKPGVSSGGSTRSFAQQVRSEEEERFGDQTRLLLNMFIQERVENTPVEPIIREVCPIDRRSRAGLSDESLSDIALTLRRIGDDISQNVELNTFIEKVPIASSRDIFIKVCQQIFLDGNLNWGRVVALFYFAYRLTIRTLSQGMDSVPWVRDMMSWAVDFIVKNFATWIMSRGGWSMIKEWFGMSSQTWMFLFFGSLAFGIWAYFKKD